MACAMAQAMKKEDTIHQLPKNGREREAHGKKRMKDFLVVV